MSKQDFIYNQVAKTMIEAMESTDGVPWRQEWTGSWLPRNGYSGRLYNGINVWILQATAWRKKYKSNDWFTFKSANKANGRIIKGQKSIVYVVYWNNKEYKTGKTLPNGKEEVKKALYIKYYPVWNKEQIDFDERHTCHAPKIVNNGAEIGASEACLEHMINDGVTLAEGEPCYVPHYDRVEMPPQGSFINAETYVSTLFHELSHATMHPTRLQRNIPKMGKDSYAREELVAELASAYICNYYQICADLQDRHAKYLKHWVTQMKRDPKYIFKVAREAQEAARYVLAYPQETVWTDDTRQDNS